MRFEKLKELIDDEDLLVMYDNTFIWEYADKGEVSCGHTWKENTLLNEDGEEYEVQDEIDDTLLEVYKYEELQILLSNILKVIKSQESEKLDYIAWSVDGWGCIINYMEEELMERGAERIGHILKLKRVKL